MPLDLFNNKQPKDLFSDAPMDLFKEDTGIVESSARVGGAIVGGLIAMPIAGIAGAAKGIGSLIQGAPDIGKLISGEEKLSGQQETELIDTAMAKAGEKIEQIAGIPMKLIQTEGQQKAVEIIMKPMEWIETAGQFYGDAAYEKWKDPELAASVKTGFEIVAFFGLPKLAFKLKAGLKAKSPKVVNDTIVQIHRERLRLLAEEPNRLETLARAEKNIAAEIQKDTKLKQLIERNAELEKITPESQFIQDKFQKRFIESEKAIKPGKEPIDLFKEKPKAVYEDFAVKLKDGEIVTGKSHTDAVKDVPLNKLDGAADGFVTSEGKFTTRPIDKGGVEIDGTELIGREVKAVLPTKYDAPKNTTLYSGISPKEFAKVGDLWTKSVGTLVWDKAIMKGIPKLLEKIPGGRSINRALIYGYRGNLPKSAEYIKSMEGMRRYQSIGREYAIDLGKRLQATDQATQLKIGEVIVGELDIKKLSPSERKLAKEAIDTMYDLGRQAVDAGFLAEKTFFKKAGRYMPRLYTSKEYKGLLTKYNMTKPNRLDLSRIKKREDIPKEIRQEMGEILTPGYPIAKGITQLTHDIETARFFNGIAKNPDWSLPFNTKKQIPKGWEKLPENKKLGALSESYTHPEIFADIQETIRVMETPERVWRKALGAWKYGKVIISPKTHVRNLMSNSILAHLGGMPMYEQPIYLARAAKSLAQSDKFWKLAKDEGLLDATFTNAELRTLFSDVDSAMGGIKANSIPEALGIIGKSWEKFKGAGRGAARLYELEEQWFKMAKFHHNISRKKMTARAAATDAEKWLFNYAKVTKFQEKYRSKWYGAPFATFTFKALPRVTEAAIKTPWRFALPAYMIYRLEQAAMDMIGDTKEQFKAKKKMRPEWQQGSFMGVVPNFARFPFVDEYGREHYLNLSYILPWGDLAEGGDFAGIPGSLMPLSMPFIKEPFQQIANYDTFWRENIVKESDLAGKSKLGKAATHIEKRGKHLGQAMLPTPVIDISKGYATLKGRPDYKGRLRAPGVVAADVFAGVKLYPVDYADQLQRRISKNNPAKGHIARKIKSEIKTYSIQRQKMAELKRDTSVYDKLIEAKVNQLFGLAEEVKKTSRTYRKTK